MRNLSVEFYGFVGVGGKNVFQTAKKRANGPKCPITGKRIAGVSPIPVD